MAETAQQPFIGSVVDNSALGDILGNESISISEWPVADFPQQMKRWIGDEENEIRTLSDEKIHLLQNNTVFVVSFGLWDIWYLVDLGSQAAVPFINRKIEVIMEQLNILSDRTGGTNETKVILTSPMDVSFLPAFESKKELAKEKSAVDILRYWSINLKTAAERWDHGNIYLFDINEFVLKLIRDWQLFAAGILEEDGMGKNEEPGWENVWEPCVLHGGVGHCGNPGKYLFW